MGFSGARVVLLCCFLIHFAFNSDSFHLQLGGKHYYFIFLFQESLWCFIQSLDFWPIYAAIDTT